MRSKGHAVKAAVYSAFCLVWLTVTNERIKNVPLFLLSVIGCSAGFGLLAYFVGNRAEQHPRRYGIPEHEHKYLVWSDRFICTECGRQWKFKGWLMAATIIPFAVVELSLLVCQFRYGLKLPAFLIKLANVQDGGVLFLSLNVLPVLVLWSGYSRLIAAVLMRCGDLSRFIGKEIDPEE